MVRVPVPLTCDADARGTETLFCCTLCPTEEPNTMDAPGSGGLSPWPVSTNVRWSTASVPWKAWPEVGRNSTWKETVWPGAMEMGADLPIGPLRSEEHTSELQ